MIRSLLAGLLLISQTTVAATLVHNVRGYTMNDGEVVRFVGLEFDGGTVTRLHTDQASIDASAADEKVDGGGATLLPGLIDAHGHVSSHGRALSSVDLVAVGSEADAVERVRMFAAANAGDGWITGRGWNQVLWPGRAFPCLLYTSPSPRDA